jgi:phosphoribosylformimino-5-aminoimidazole carboxamide ribotide isomerase
MLIVPAIDIKDGKVVRLIQGKYGKKVYSEDPLKIARYWQREGAKLIHLVDLDGASGRGINNLDLIKEIIKKVDVPIEVGGGLRDKKTVKDLINSGACRVVIGTKALNESFLCSLFRQFRERIIVSIDEKSGTVLTSGWRVKNKSIDPFSFALKLKRMGFREIIYTDVNRDGTLEGPNLSGIKRMLKTGLGVIASGGISSLADILKLTPLEKHGLIGIITGKALYEKMFTLEEAMRTVSRKEEKYAGRV